MSFSSEHSDAVLKQVPFLIVVRSTTRFLENVDLKEPDEGAEEDIGPLNEFFDVNPDPNPAEIKFLALCLELEENDVRKWCRFPREYGMKPLFNILHVVEIKKVQRRARLFADRLAYCGDTPAVSDARKRKYNIQNGIAKADGSTRDIIDPSLRAHTLSTSIVGQNKIIVDKEKE